MPEPEKQEETTKPTKSETISTPTEVKATDPKNSNNVMKNFTSILNRVTKGVTDGVNVISKATKGSNAISQVTKGVTNGVNAISQSISTALNSSSTNTTTEKTPETPDQKTKNDDTTSHP